MGVDFTPAQIAQLRGIVPCLICDEDDNYAFEFDRLLAARAALALSEFTPTEIANAGTGTHSAIFMSLVYYAGGIPMISTEVGGGWSAWWAEQRINGSNVWNNHSLDYIVKNGASYGEASDWATFEPSDMIGGRLVQLIASAPTLGGPDMPGDAIVEWETPDKKALLVPVLKFFRVVDGTYLLNSNAFNNKLGNIAADVLQNNQQMIAALIEFCAGDYVWYTDGPDAHGLVVVGYGPAIDWGQFVRDVETSDIRTDVHMARVGGDSVRGYQFAVRGPGASTVADYTDAFGVDAVPYVVDWQTNAGEDRQRRQGPRPFYATRAPDGVAPQAEHGYWVFVPAPLRGKVRCPYVRAINCDGAEISIDSNGDLIIPSGT